MASDERNVWKMVGDYLGLAMLLPLCTFVGYAIGYFLDQAFHTHFFYLIFLLFGIAAGFVELIRQVQKDSGDRGS